jgi:hypothetical protein
LIDIKNQHIQIKNIFSLKLNDEVSVKLSREHSSYKWVDLNDAIHLVFSWTNKAALKAIPNFIY